MSATAAFGGEIQNVKVAVSSTAARCAEVPGRAGPRSPNGVIVSVDSGATTVRVGGEDITTGIGTQITAGNAVSFPVDDPSRLWVICSSTSSVQVAWVGAPLS